MARPGDGRPLEHSKSWSGRDGWNVDKALSVGFNKSRESLPQTWPRLKDGISDLKKLEVVKQQLRSSNAEINDVKKNNKDPQEEYEDVKKENEEVKKENEEVKKENEAVKKENEEVKKENKDLKKEYEVVKKKYEDVKKENKDLQSAEASLESKLELRAMLQKFKRCYHGDNEGLMILAHDMFSMDFPCDPSRTKDATFTGTIAALQNEKANELTKYKLDRLRDVAMTFRSKLLPWWNAELGKQFFILCKSVPQWNNDDFHPAMEGMERLEYSKKARKGMYSVDGVNLKPVVLELLHI